MIQHVNPGSLSPPTGYSHVVITPPGRQVHVSGQVALDGQGRLVGPGDLAAQAEQVFANLEKGLKSCGARFADVFKLTAFVVDLTPEKAQLVRAVRAEWLGAGPFPASTMVGVQALVAPELLIEIEASAALE